MKLIEFFRVCKTGRVIINMERYNVLVYAGARIMYVNGLKIGKMTGEKFRTTMLI